MKTEIPPQLRKRIEAYAEKVGVNPIALEESIDMFTDTLIQIFHNEKRNGRI